MLLQRKIDGQFANVRSTNVNLRTVQLLSTLTPALLAAEQRLNATQVLNLLFTFQSVMLCKIRSSLFLFYFSKVN